ncbi:MAG: helix-turn-helix domain-containing protein [Rhodomicrobium sp.]
MEYQAGETLHGLAKRHGISRHLVRIWAAKAESGEFDDDLTAASILQGYEARIGALERLVGKLVLENEFLKGLRGRLPAGKRDYVRHCRPRGSPGQRRMPADGSGAIDLL